MTLRETIEAYIEWRQAHGAKFVTGAQVLRLFHQSIGEEISCDGVTTAQIRVFLSGNGSLTRTRANKYGALASFFRYAISRGYASVSPLPLADDEPRRPSSAPPYIYSHEELRGLFGAIDSSRKSAVQLDAYTFRTLLLLLYGAGLRGGEARRLTVADVDLSAAVLNVRDTKFYKSRLVPVGSQLADTLRGYAVVRARRRFPAGKDSTFLANHDGTPLIKGTVQDAFTRLCRSAGIRDTDAMRQSPCLHSFRHTFAVHRLTDWYRKGADVQRLLPVLSTYLGHAKLVHTQVYLSMTPELLQQASLLFDRYLKGANNE